MSVQKSFALHDACQRGEEDTVLSLLENQDIDVNQVNVSFSSKCLQLDIGSNTNKDSNQGGLSQNSTTPCGQRSKNFVCMSFMQY
jgi:hypothetical protein